jgi:hypothetical protein
MSPPASDDKAVKVTLHAHSHEAPDHHYGGYGDCDPSCREGRRDHPHQVLKGEEDVIDEAVTHERHGS